MTNFDAEQIVAEARDKGEPALETLVFQALGAASACWENLEGAGVFESTRAKDIGDQTVAAIRGLAGEYKTKDSTHCDAKASWGSNRLTHTHECTKDEHHARERHECECGASWLAKVEA
jgi:hypothetical protein